VTQFILNGRHGPEPARVTMKTAKAAKVVVDGVGALYHPCANDWDVRAFRLWRHI
jgi:hypothetical protein